MTVEVAGLGMAEKMTQVEGRVKLLETVMMTEVKMGLEETVATALVMINVMEVMVNVMEVTRAVAVVMVTMGMIQDVMLQMLEVMLTMVVAEKMATRRGD